MRNDACARATHPAELCRSNNTTDLVGRIYSGLAVAVSPERVYETGARERRMQRLAAACYYIANEDRSLRRPPP